MAGSEYQHGVHLLLYPWLWWWCYFLGQAVTWNCDLKSSCSLYVALVEAFYSSNRKRNQDSVCLSIYLPIHPPIHLSIYQSINHLSVLSIIYHLSIHLSISYHLYIYLFSSWHRLESSGKREPHWENASIELACLWGIFEKLMINGGGPNCGWCYP